MKNQILSVSELDELQSKLKTIEAILHVKIDNLPVLPNNGAIAMGNRSRAFIEKSYELALNFPDSISPLVDMERFGINTETARSALALETATKRILSHICKIKAVTGKLAYGEALKYYKFLKMQNQHGTKGIRQILDELSFFFRRSKRIKAEGAVAD
jgi:hypothetical protein